MRTPGNWGARSSWGRSALQETASETSKFARRRCFAPDATQSAPVAVADGATMGRMTRCVQTGSHGLFGPRTAIPADWLIGAGRRRPDCAYRQCGMAAARVCCGGRRQVTGHDLRMSAGARAGEGMSGRRPVAPARTLDRRPARMRPAPSTKRARLPRCRACHGAMGGPRAPRRAWPGTLPTTRAPPGPDARLGRLGLSMPVSADARLAWPDRRDARPGSTIHGRGAAAGDAYPRRICRTRTGLRGPSSSAEALRSHAIAAAAARGRRSHTRISRRTADPTTSATRHGYGAAGSPTA